MTQFAYNFIELFAESAPWLLMGLFIAGAMQWLIPMDWLNRQVGADSFGAIVKGALLGAPLPLCSCGVIPAALGLRRAGASKPATVSFLIATPETGVDSISVSYALLGPFMALIRPIAAIFSAIYAGLLVNWFARETVESPQSPSIVADTCCSKQNENKSCCEKSASSPNGCGSNESFTWRTRWVQWWQFSSGQLLGDIVTWLLIGLLVAAAVKTWIGEDFLAQWGQSWAAMLVMALVGVPMYICATASTPIAASFLALGISPGAVMVFLLAGPATNLSTMGMVRKELGNAALMAYLGAIFSASIGLGYLVNWLVAAFQVNITLVAAQAYELNHSMFTSISAILLAALMLKYYWSQLFQGR